MDQQLYWNQELRCGLNVAKGIGYMIFLPLFGQMEKKSGGLTAKGRIPFGEVVAVEPGVVDQHLKAAERVDAALHGALRLV